MSTIKVTPNGAIEIEVSISLRKHGSKKRIITPEDDTSIASSPDAVLAAIARAYRWQELIDRGECKTIDEISQKLKLDHSYIARILRLNQLSPNIVRLFINGKAPSQLSLAKLTQVALPVKWEEQEATLLP